MVATRYMRYIIVAALFLTVILLFSTTETPQAGLRVAQQRMNEFIEKQKSQFGSSPIEKPIADGKTSLEEEKKEKEKEDADKDGGEDGDKDPETNEDSVPDAPPGIPESTVSWTPPNSFNKRPPGVAGKMNATFVTLARNSDLEDISMSIKEVEDRFNHRYNYDWIFLNDQPFDEEFKSRTTHLVSGKTKYATIATEHWSFPSWIDQEKAKKVREEMHEKQIIYGDSISYRHMCRFESGFFYREPLLKDYEWYWRVEPSIKLPCDIDFDVFKYMHDNNKIYGHTISLYEYLATIPTLWGTIKEFLAKNPQYVAPNNSMGFISDDGGKSYNLCHFWSNFEIGNLDWLRSKAYSDYFDYLDKAGGFFYERWGDAPVHSLAAALMLPKEAIHLFEDISYYHVPFTHCPNSEETRLKKRCFCKKEDSFDWNGYSCMRRFYKLHGWDLPEGVSWDP